MIKVNNKKIINETTFALLKYNKKRNIMATLAIILTTFMFTSIFTLISGIKDSARDAAFIMTGNDYHIVFKEVNTEKINKLVNHNLIEKYNVTNVIGLCKNSEFYGEHVTLTTVDNDYYRHSFIDLIEGKYPERENEILIDGKLLTLLGKTHDIGQEIQLKYEIINYENTHDFDDILDKRIDNFVVSGIFEGSDLALSKAVFLHKDFEKNISIPDGNKYLNILTNNSNNLDKKAKEIIQDSGYYLKDSNMDNSKIIKYGTNWAYEDLSEFSIKDIINYLLPLVIIVLTGYLIIYNIFNISSYMDIKIYGLMKAIGTTYNQLKKILLKQVFIISIWSIPIGIILGYIVGNLILPLMVASNNEFAQGYVKFSTNPLIFIFTIVFTLFTIYISSMKSAKIVAKASPLTSINTEDIDSNIKISNNYKLNIKNLGKTNIKRKRSKFILVVISISISIVILNSAIAITGEPDFNSYLANTINTDFTFAEKGFYSYLYSKPIKDELINSIKSQSSFKDGGCIYRESSVENPIVFKDLNNNEDIYIYGMDKYILNKQNLILGNNNLQLDNLNKNEIIMGFYYENEESARNTKQYILDGKYKYSLNDKIKLNINGREEEYTIVGFIQADLTNTSASLNPNIIYLDIDDYSKIYKNPSKMVFQFDVNDNSHMENYLKELTEKYSMYKYDSREDKKLEFKNIGKNFFIISSLISLIMALIGLLNFINVSITNIIARENELELMNNVGMTIKEIKKMLTIESLYYFIYVAIIGTLFSILVAEIIIKNLSNYLYPLVYKFSLNGVFIILPIFLILTLILPSVFYNRIINKKTKVI